jgi:hypothetical protein
LNTLAGIPNSRRLSVGAKETLRRTTPHPQKFENEWTAAARQGVLMPVLAAREAR